MIGGKKDSVLNICIFILFYVILIFNSWFLSILYWHRPYMQKDSCHKCAFWWLCTVIITYFYHHTDQKESSVDPVPVSAHHPTLVPVRTTDIYLLAFKRNKDGVIQNVLFHLFCSNVICEVHPCFCCMFFTFFFFDV